MVKGVRERSGDGTPSSTPSRPRPEVPPNHRLQLTGAPGPSSAWELLADGDQRTVEFETAGLVARS